MIASGLPDVVGDDEDVARFLTSSSHYNSRIAKPAAFLPSKDGQETSVFRHGPEPSGGLWALANDHVGPERKLHGAAIMKAADKIIAKGKKIAAHLMEAAEADIVF